MGRHHLRPRPRTLWHLEIAGLVRDLEEMVELAKNTQKNGRPAWRTPTSAVVCARVHHHRGDAAQRPALPNQAAQGEPLTSETSINKLHRAFLAIEMGDLSLDIKGSASQYGKGATGGADEFKVPSGALDWPNVVIGGGTPNIQKNIIAERILGLPKD